jgi:hypothetical protein
MLRVVWWWLSVARFTFQPTPHRHTHPSSPSAFLESRTLNFVYHVNTQVYNYPCCAAAVCLAGACLFARRSNISSSGACFCVPPCSTLLPHRLLPLCPLPMPCCSNSTSTSLPTSVGEPCPPPPRPRRRSRTSSKPRRASSLTLSFTASTPTKRCVLASYSSSFLPAMGATFLPL